MSVVLNGNTHSLSGTLVGGDGYEYTRVPTFAAAGVPEWPDQVFTDMLAELALIKAPGAYSTTSNTLASSGAKSWTLAAAATLSAGTYKVESLGSPGNGMIVSLATTITSSTAFATTALASFGSGGPYADWKITPLISERQTILAKTGNYTVVAPTDFGSLIKMTGSFAVSLPASATAGSSFPIALVSASGTLTITPNGADTCALASLTAGQAVLLVLDGTVWRPVYGYGFSTTVTGSLGARVTGGTAVSLTGYTAATSDPAPAASGISGGACIGRFGCDTTGGAFTLTLPASPTAGDFVDVVDAARNFAVANLTVGRNGKSIGGVAENMTVSDVGASFRLIYGMTSNNWSIA